MRRTELANNEFYHVYNRGTEKRRIILDKHDGNRLVKSLLAFNTMEPIGSMFKEYSGHPEKLSSPATQFDDPLVDIVAYCFNPNHFHLLLKQVEDGGISKFMHKFGGGFTRFFNEKYERTGVLFQGKFKARHIKDDFDLLRMSAYVNLNDRVHSLSSPATQFVRSSREEYMGKSKQKICSKKIILEHFNSPEEYMKYAKSVVKEIVTERKAADRSKSVEFKKEFYGYYFD